MNLKEIAKKFINRYNRVSNMFTEKYRPASIMAKSSGKLIISYRNCSGGAENN
jgi:hypothetical protein